MNQQSKLIVIFLINVFNKLSFYYLINILMNYSKNN